MATNNTQGMRRDSSTYELKRRRSSRLFLYMLRDGKISGKLADNLQWFRIIVFFRKSYFSIIDLSNGSNATSRKTFECLKKEFALIEIWDTISWDREKWGDEFEYRTCFKLWVVLSWKWILEKGMIRRQNNTNIDSHCSNFPKFQHPQRLAPENLRLRCKCTLFFVQNDPTFLDPLSVSKVNTVSCKCSISYYANQGFLSSG